MSDSNDLQTGNNTPLIGTLVFILVVILVNLALTAYLASVFRHNTSFLPWQWLIWSNQFYDFDPTFFAKMYIIGVLGTGIPLVLYIRFMSRYYSKSQSEE